MGLSETAMQNDRLTTLKALRDTITSAIEGSKSDHAIAALSRQLSDILQQIEGIEKAEARSENTLSIIQAKRTARLQGGKHGTARQPKRP